MGTGWEETGWVVLRGMVHPGLNVNVQHALVKEAAYWVRLELWPTQPENFADNLYLVRVKPHL